MVFGGMKPIDDTRLSDITEFLNQAIKLVDKTSKTNKEMVFSAYVTKCRDRLYANRQIEDYKPLKQVSKTPYGNTSTALIFRCTAIVFLSILQQEATQVQTIMA